MKKIIKNLLSFLVGITLGGMLNGRIIALSTYLIPPPSGTDLTTEAGLKAAMPLMEPKHFLMPFLAHALGTLLGAVLAAFIAASHKMQFALAVGLMFLIGGAMMVFLLPDAPLWFKIVDLVGAYIPLAYLGGRIGIQHSFSNKYK